MGPAQEKANAIILAAGQYGVYEGSTKSLQQAILHLPDDAADAEIAAAANEYIAAVRQVQARDAQSRAYCVGLREQPSAGRPFDDTL